MSEANAVAAPNAEQAAKPGRPGPMLGRLRAAFDLTRPETLLLPMAAVASGATASAVKAGAIQTLVVTERVAPVALAMALLNAASNVLNQVCDLETDRINKPWRPLPAGKLTQSEGLVFAVGLYAAGLSAAALGGLEVFSLAVVILLATIAYSVPPIRLKRWAWPAQATIALARGVLLPVVGWSCVAPALADFEPWGIGTVFGLFLLGASAAKDFTDVPGDLATGCNTLPSLYGPRGASWRIAPFFVAPWLLWPTGAWLCRMSGEPLIGGNRIVLTLLGVSLALCGLRAVVLLGDLDATAGAGPRSENHPAWRLMYRMMMAAYLGIAVASLL
jgi:chlorophyll/bacteriochlorophyll a synthase